MLCRCPERGHRRGIGERSGKLVIRPGSAAPVGETGRGHRTPQPVRFAAAIAGFPLDLVIVEFNVEITGPGVEALDEHELEFIELVSVAAVVAHPGPVDAERGSAVDDAGAIPDIVVWRSRARVHVGEEWSDLRQLAGGWQTGRRVGAIGDAKCHVAVIIDEQIRVRRTKEVDRRRKPYGHRPGGAVIVSR